MLRVAAPVELFSLPPTFESFIVNRDVNRQPKMRHVRGAVPYPRLFSWELTGKGSTGPTVRMSTLCFLSASEPFGKMASNSPLGRYCLSCGSAIKRLPMLASWVSSSDTISLNGLKAFLSDRLIYCSLMRELENARHNADHMRTGFLIRWWLTRRGKSTSWPTADSNYGPTLTDALDTLMRAETGRALNRWWYRMARKRFLLEYLIRNGQWRLRDGARLPGGELPVRG